MEQEAKQRAEEQQTLLLEQEAKAAAERQLLAIPCLNSRLCVVTGQFSARVASSIPEEEPETSLKPSSDAVRIQLKFPCHFHERSLD